MGEAGTARADAPRAKWPAWPTPFANRGRVLNDLIAVWRRRDLAFGIASAGLQSRLLTTVLGSAWHGLNFAIFVGGISALWAIVFDMPVAALAPHVGLGYFVFSFMAGILTDGARSIVGSRTISLQNAIPPLVLPVASVVKHVMISAQALPTVLAILLLFPPPLSALSAVAALGIALNVIFALAVAVILGLICIFIRDLTEFIAAAMRFMFFVTPVVWVPSDRPELHLVLMLNPIYHCIEVVRGPIMGSTDVMLSFVILCGLTLLALGIAAGLYRALANRVTLYL